MNIILFAFIGYFLFQKSRYFETPIQGILQLYILLSTCNFPDVMLSTFSNDNKFPFFYFLLYLAINYFILFTLLKTLYYTHYFDSLKAEARKAIEARRAEEAKKAEEARLAEETRKAEEAAKAAPAVEPAEPAKPTAEEVKKHVQHVQWLLQK